MENRSCVANGEAAVNYPCLVYQGRTVVSLLHSKFFFHGNDNHTVAVKICTGTDGNSKAVSRSVFLHQGTL